MFDMITKDAATGDKREFNFAFTPATDMELKLLGDDLPNGYIAGWASTPDMDRSHDIILAGAFDDSIARKGLTGPKGIKLLISHDWQKMAGIIHRLETRNGRLWIEAQLNLDVSYVKDTYVMAKMIGGLNFSVGFRLVDYAFKEDSDGNEYLEVAKGDLFEVSIVPVPDNEEAVMTIIKDADDPSHVGGFEADMKSMAIFEKALVADGFVVSRNKAKELTMHIKEHVHLFVKAKAPAADVPKSLTSDNLAGVQKALDEMKAILSS